MNGYQKLNEKEAITQLINIKLTNTPSREAWGVLV